MPKVTKEVFRGAPIPNLEHLRREDFGAVLAGVCVCSSKRRALGRHGGSMTCQPCLWPQPRPYVAKARPEGRGPRQNCVCHLDTSGASWMRPCSGWFGKDPPRTGPGAAGLPSLSHPSAAAHPHPVCSRAGALAPPNPSLRPLEATPCCSSHTSPSPALAAQKLTFALRRR